MARTILIVDDDADIRATFAGLYGGEYRVLSAADGAAGLAILASESPRLLILDISMPGMSGLEVLAAAKALRPALSVFMLTSEQDVETARRALELGAKQFVTKPFDIDYLRAEIAKEFGVELRDESGAPWTHKP